MTVLRDIAKEVREWVESTTKPGELINQTMFKIRELAVHVEWLYRRPVVGEIDPEYFQELGWSCYGDGWTFTSFEGVVVGYENGKLFIFKGTREITIVKHANISQIRMLTEIMKG